MSAPRPPEDLPMSDWPAWWSWDLELSSHLRRRMIDRAFNEVDLRLMLETARGHRRNHAPGRFTVETAHAGAAWEVIVAPDSRRQLLVVVTAYQVG